MKKSARTQSINDLPPLAFQQDPEPDSSSSDSQRISTWDNSGQEGPPIAVRRPDGSRNLDMEEAVQPIAGDIQEIFKREIRQTFSSKRKQRPEEEVHPREVVRRIKKTLDSLSVNRDPHDPTRISCFLKACRVLLERGFEPEVDRHVGHFLWERQQRGNRPFMPVMEGQSGENPYTLSPELQWWCSLIDWAECELRGWEEGLKRIPGLLLLDHAFFIGQPWVHKNILHWYEQGDEKKLRQLFWGASPKGNPKWLSKKRLSNRDLQVYAEVSQLHTGRGQYNKALRQAQENLKKRGIDLTVPNIQAIYDKYRKGFSRFSSLSIFF